jgi:pimeloyl-ACP methyl ester carboxylesterase
VNQHGSSTDHVTPYDRFAWNDTQVEHLLATGMYARELIAYFGTDEYLDLVRLTRRAAQAPRKADAPRVYVVPGIMGSQLGCARREPLPNDILWLDPMDISMGQLSALHLGSGRQVVSLGIVLYTYLRMKLHLRIAGFAPVCYHYDWRLGVDELGRAFAETLAADPAEHIMIVAHSMGGLVGRAALTHPAGRKVQRLVLLGTPNTGSYAPVQALRGVYAVVRKIARLSHTQSAEQLAQEVFATFPSLYHLLPSLRGAREMDFFDPAAWPAKGPRPDQRLLARARELQSVLAPADERFTVIAGNGQETVTRVSRRRDQFTYTITRNGDGTVPLVCAQLQGAKTYYTSVAHSELTRDPVVAEAVADVLRTGQTPLLKANVPRASNASAQITDAQLARTHVEKVDWAGLSPDARRIFLQTLNEPPQLKLRTPTRTKASPSRAGRVAHRHK